MAARFRLRAARCLLICLGCGTVTCSATELHFRLQSREVLESHLKSFSDKNSDREARIKQWLSESGCQDGDLTEQALDRKAPPNVICILPGETAEVIVVGAHTDKVESYGDGVVDNWTGAVLLPALLYSLNSRPRHHTIIFVGFSAEEKGLVGSRFYADHLSPQERARIEAMVNFDSLGVSPTKVWASHADKPLLNALIATSSFAHLPISAVNVEGVGSTDSESFAPYHIPRITIHSITQDTFPILHSVRDKLTAINFNDYYDSYRLIAEYLAYLDGMLTPPAPAATAEKAKTAN